MLDPSLGIEAIIEGSSRILVRLPPFKSIKDGSELRLFDNSYKQAFLELRRRLIEAPIVKPPNWSRPFELMCDALDFALGAVLVQWINKFPHVISYASRTLNVAQSHYTTVMI